MAPGRRISLAGAIVLALAGVPAQAATVRISMEDLEIAPAEVTAKVGDTVEWTNKDDFAHTATAQNGQFDVDLPPNKTGRVVLQKAGTVSYYCRYHPNMKATLKIEP